MIKIIIGIDKMVLLAYYIMEMEILNMNTITKMGEIIEKMVLLGFGIMKTEVLNVKCII
jgi:hypothetical protein